MTSPGALIPMRFNYPANRLLKESQKSRIVEMKCSPCEIRVADASPPRPANREVLKELIKKAALIKLRQMQYEA
jgi:hypothetical protein